MLEEGKFVDYYEFLMISPQADRAMIEWAVRLMLTRYGKKNQQQADPEKYELVKEAYRALADPKRRAEYDREREKTIVSAGKQAVSSAPEWPTREEGEAPDPDSVRVELEAGADDVRYQRRLRQAIMSALYDILITRPRNPELGRAEIGRAIGVRIDELEFAIWFLRERELMKTTAQGLYAITSKGVEWVENGGVPHLAEGAAAPHALPARTERLEQAAAGPRRVL